MQVIEPVALVPNILLDQIIDRKLNALHEGKEKSGLLADRAEKLESVGIGCKCQSDGLGNGR